MKTQTVYLVDTENVNEILVAFYTDNSPKLSWERMADFAAKGCEFEAIGCHKGTNALDFQLVSYLGYMIASKRDCHYVIISNDKGYDPVSCFWQERGIQIKRQPIQTKMEKKASPQPVAKESVVLKIFICGAVRSRLRANGIEGRFRSGPRSDQIEGRVGSNFCANQKKCAGKGEIQFRSELCADGIKDRARSGFRADEIKDRDKPDPRTGRIKGRKRSGPCRGRDQGQTAAAGLVKRRKRGRELIAGCKRASGSQGAEQIHSDFKRGGFSPEPQSSPGRKSGQSGL